MRSADELRIRIKVCAGAIQLLQNECAGDPRQPEAILHYEKQLRKLEAELAEAEQQLIEPKPIVIGLKSASISGKAGM